MGIPRHLGVFIFTVGSGSFSGATSANWLFGGAPGSVLRHVQDCTRDAFDVTVGVFHIDPPAYLHDVLKDKTASRQMRLRYYADAARLAGHLHFDQYDGLVFGCFGGVMDTGAGSVYDKLPGKRGYWLPACVFDEIASHNGICHEVCHVLGLQHPYWLADKQYPFGEYGDPYCVMGRSGVTATSFSLPHDASSGIANTAVLWGTAGPGVSPTVLWRHVPPNSPLPSWVHVLPLGTGEATIVLRRAGAQPNGRPSVVAVQTAEGWWTVEYRAGQDWDQGLAQQGIKVNSAAGLVIHKVSRLGEGSGLPTFPRDNCVQYQDTLPFPGIGDDDWANAEFGVRVDEAVPEGIRIRIGRQLASAKTLRIDDGQVAGPATRTMAGWENIPLTGPDCQGAAWPLDLVSRPVTVTVTTRSTGFQNPRFLFTLNGNSLGTFAAGDTTEGGVSHMWGIPTLIPTGRFTTTHQSITIQLSWTKQGNRLVLSLPAGIGRVQLELTVQVVEASGGSVMTSAKDIEVETSSIELPPAAQASLEACIQRLAREAWQIYHPIDQVPGQPDPIDGPDWRDLRGVRLLALLLSVNALEERSVVLAHRLRAQIADELGAEEGMLVQISRLLEVGDKESRDSTIS